MVVAPDVALERLLQIITSAEVMDPLKSSAYKCTAVLNAQSRAQLIGDVRTGGFTRFGDKQPIGEFLAVIRQHGRDAKRRCFSQRLEKGTGRSCRPITHQALPIRV